MEDTLIPAIIMAIISSLAFIAYKHPKGYSDIHYVLVFGLIIIWAIWGAYIVGYSQGQINYMHVFIKINGDLSYKLPGEDDPFTSWFYILPPSIFVYLQILKILPKILHLPMEDDKKDDPENRTSNKKDPDPK